MNRKQFSTQRHTNGFRPLSWGLFFNKKTCKTQTFSVWLVFVPFLGDFFSIRLHWKHRKSNQVFVPFPGDFFSIASAPAPAEAASCFRPLSRGLFFNSVPAKPQPVCSRKRISGGDGGSLHQALSSEMKCRFSQSGRASAGICNEKTEKRNGGAAHKNMEPPRRFETSDFLVSQT